MEIRKYRVREIKWNELVNIAQFPLPVQVTVPVADLNDPQAQHADVTVTVVSTYMLRQFLADHIDWSFIAPEIGQGDWATDRFADRWIDFLNRKDSVIYRSVRALAMEYNPALTYFKHESGTVDGIEYGRTNVTNSGGLSQSTTSSGKTGSASIGTAGTDGYRETTVNTATADGADVKTISKVSTYDDDTAATLSEVTNEGDTASLSGSTNSAKSVDSGKDTHSRDLYVDGSDALHTTIDMIKAEIEMRLSMDFGKMLLEEFANETLFLEA